MRLIDADALIERLKTKSDKIMDKEPAIAGALLGAIYMISHAPTIEPTAHQGRKEQDNENN